MSPKTHYSSRHFPLSLTRVLNVLAARAAVPAWKVHNKALRMGLRMLWEQQALGAWPEDEIPKGKNGVPKTEG